MLNKYFDVNGGFIALKDFMGGDIDIEQAARTSYQKGTRQVSDTRKLIRSLMRDGHYSPFEQVEFKFHLKLPLTVANQLVRHRTFSFNFCSYRYSEVPNDMYYPTKSRYTTQSENKQGSTQEEIFHTDGFITFERFQKDLNEGQFKLYENLVSRGCSREVARQHLPQSVYTIAYVKCDLRNLLHFLKQRLDEHAQWEIRQYARYMAGFVKEICPISWEAFEDYSLYAQTFSQEELRVIKSAAFGGGEIDNFDLDLALHDSELTKKEQSLLRKKLEPKQYIDCTLDFSRAQ